MILTYVKCGEIIPRIDYVIPKIVSTFVMLIKIGIPIVLIIMGSIDMVKAVVSQNEDNMKKAQTTFIKRLLAGITTFLIVTVVQTIFNLIIRYSGEDGTSLWRCVTCFLNAGEYCEGYTETHGTDIDFGTGQNGIDDIVEIQQPNINNKANYGSKLIINTFFNENYYVVNTKNSLINVVSKIKSNKVTQNSDRGRYGSSCLDFATYYAYNLKCADKMQSMNPIRAEIGGLSYKSTVNKSISVIHKLIYDKLSIGEPIMITVGGSKIRGGYTRHFVLAVGFKERVNSLSDFGSTDILILDPWDGKVKQLGNFEEKNHRFLLDYPHPAAKGYRADVFKQC